MARMSKQEQWKQETAKLKAHGFTWRFVGFIEGERGLPVKQWQLSTPSGEQINKVDALARIEQEEEWEEFEKAARFQASIHEVYWKGHFSEAVSTCDELVMPAFYGEGESYIAFPAEVQITLEGNITRYTLPSGKVFVMTDTLLHQEGEPGYEVPIKQERT